MKHHQPTWAGAIPAPAFFSLRARFARASDWPARALLFLALFISFPATLSAMPQEVAARARITTATGVRLRREPQMAAEEVARLSLGVLVRELERSDQKEKVGATEDYWYRVAAPNGAEGWLFGGLTAPFDAARRGAIYLKIANDRLKIEEASFAERADLFKFLDRVAAEITGRAPQGELELLRLLALHKSLAAIPFDKLEAAPYKDWTTEHAARIVYSEPAGQWFVRADALWALEKKYRGLPLAERIAWEASRLPLPGECEGYLPCALSVTSLTDGEYLKLYPRGAHASEAINSISEFLDSVLENLKGSNPVYEVPPQDRAGFRKEVADLSVTITRASHARSAGVLSKLNQLAARFR